MAKLTKRTTEQLRSYLSSLAADELVEVLLSHAVRDNELRDRLLIESAKRGGADVDLKSFQRSINAAVFDPAESRYGSERFFKPCVAGSNLAEGAGAGRVGVRLYYIRPLWARRWFDAAAKSVPQC